MDCDEWQILEGLGAHTDSVTKNKTRRAIIDPVLEKRASEKENHLTKFNKQLSIKRYRNKLKEIDELYLQIAELLLDIKCLT